MYIYSHICMYIYLCIYLSTYMYIYIYEYIYIYIHIYTHTYIYVYIYVCVSLSLSFSFPPFFLPLSLSLSFPDIFKIIHICIYIFFRVYCDPQTSKYICMCTPTRCSQKSARYSIYYSSSPLILFFRISGLIVRNTGDRRVHTKKFSQISLQSNLLHIITIQPTFQNLSWGVYGEFLQILPIIHFTV